MSNLTQFTRAGGEAQGRKIVFAFFVRVRGIQYPTPSRGACISACHR